MRRLTELGRALPIGLVPWAIIALAAWELMR